MTTTPVFSPAVARHHDLRSAWLDELERRYLAAERETRGHMLNQRGRAAGIDPRTLFYGTAARANAYASSELKDHWLTHPRLTYRGFVQAAAAEACPTCGGAFA